MSDAEVEVAARTFQQTGGEADAEGYMAALMREGRLSPELKNVARACVVNYRWCTGERVPRPITAAETANVLLGRPVDMAPVVATAARAAHLAKQAASPHHPATDRFNPGARLFGLDGLPGPPR